jgi:hypothetical protein
MTNEEREADARTIPTGIAGELVVEALAGAAAGAIAGTLGGPPGIAIGACLGGAIGAMAGEAAHMGQVEAAREDAALDGDIGVDGGDIGAAAPDQPEARNPIHAASLGVATGATVPSSDGPIQNLDA